MSIPLSISVYSIQRELVFRLSVKKYMSDMIHVPRVQEKSLSAIIHFLNFRKLEFRRPSYPLRAFSVGPELGFQFEAFALTQSMSASIYPSIYLSIYLCRSSGEV